MPPAAPSCSTTNSAPAEPPLGATGIEAERDMCSGRRPAVVRQTARGALPRDRRQAIRSSPDRPATARPDALERDRGTRLPASSLRLRDSSHLRAVDCPFRLTATALLSGHRQQRHPERNLGGLSLRPPARSQQSVSRLQIGARLVRARRSLAPGRMTEPPRLQGFREGERRDSNPRPPGPQPGVLRPTRLRSREPCGDRAHT
jgi:hypothetical protein